MFFIVLGVLIYLFGVKFAYYGQVCDMVLSGREISADNAKSGASESIN